LRPVGDIGGDHRHAGQRQLQRHGAGDRDRRDGLAKGLPFARRGAGDEHRHVPGADGVEHELLFVPRGGQHEIRNLRMALQRQRHLLHQRQVPAQLAAAAAGEEQQRTTRGLRVAQDGVLQRGMADIGGGRPVEPLHHRRLERQHGQHFVEQWLEKRCALRLPGPDAGRDVKQDAAGVAAPAQLLRHHLAEHLGIDEHHQVGFGGEDGPDRLADAPQQQRRAPQDVLHPHDREVGHGKKRLQPLSGQAVAADPQERERPADAQPAHEVGADAVAGRLTGEDEQARRISHGARRRC
jgi:hypothetical protein